MRKKNLLYIFFSSLILIPLLTILFLTTLNLTPNLISPKKLTINEKSYLISPINSYNNSFASLIDLPTIQTSPLEKKYFFTQLQEKMDYFFGTYDDYFFARKRLAEIFRWSSNLPIEGPMSLTTQMNKYYLSFKRYLGKKSKIEFSDTVSNIKRHNYCLISTFNQLNISNKDKKYLIDLTNSTYKNLYKILSKKFPQQANIPINFSPTSLSYSLSQIDEEREWGKYDISFDKPSYDFDINLTNLQVGGVIFFPAKNQNEESNQTIIFNNIPINNNSHYLALNLKPLNLAKSFTLVKTASSGGTVKYQGTLNYSFNPDLRYLIKINYNNSLFSHLKLEFYDKKDKRSYDYDLPISKDGSFQEKIELNDIDQTDKLIVTITTSPSFKKTSTPVFKIELIPLYEPQITLIKTGELPNQVANFSLKKISHNHYNLIQKNITLEQENQITNNFGFGWTKLKDNEFYYWPNKAFLILFFICFVIELFLADYLWFKRITPILQSIFLKIANTFKEIFVKIWQKIKSICFINKRGVLVLFLICLFIDIFIIKAQLDSIVIFVTSLWIMVLIGYWSEARSNFFMAFVIFLLTPLFILINRNSVAEKMTIWAYMFLIVGAVQSVIETRNERIVFKDARRFFKEISIDFKIFYLLEIIKNYPVSIIESLKENVSKVWLCYQKNILGKRPKTFSEWAKFIIKITISIVILLITVYLLIASLAIITKKIIAYDLKLKRLRLNPKIVKIEPLYVYPGQKVILIGTNFCNNDRVNCTVEFSHHKEKIIDLMSGGKIIFTIPLDLKKNTDVYVKIKKKISWLGKPEIAESNAVKFKLLDPLTPWNADTDAYFEQMKNLSDEAKRINGLD